jgi:hypothetical protein
MRGRRWWCWMRSRGAGNAVFNRAGEFVELVYRCVHARMRWFHQRNRWPSIEVVFISQMGKFAPKYAPDPSYQLAPYPRTKHPIWRPTKQPARTFLLNTPYMIFRPKHPTWLHSPRVLRGWLLDGCFVRDLDEKLKSCLVLGCAMFGANLPTCLCSELGAWPASINGANWVEGVG